MVGVCHSFESFLKMYCRYCDTRGLLKDKLSDSAFISSGFNNWKKALQRFEQHSQSNAHKEALLRIELRAANSTFTIKYST